MLALITITQNLLCRLLWWLLAGWLAGWLLLTYTINYGGTLLHTLTHWLNTLKNVAAELTILLLLITTLLNWLLTIWKLPRSCQSDTLQRHIIPTRLCNWRRSLCNFTIDSGSAVTFPKITLQNTHRLHKLPSFLTTTQSAAWLPLLLTDTNTRLTLHLTTLLLPNNCMHWLPITASYLLLLNMLLREGDVIL